MKLTPKNKAYIDSLSHEQLRSHLRFAPMGDPWLRGETREYWKERLSTSREVVSTNFKRTLISGSKDFCEQFVRNLPPAVRDTRVDIVMFDPYKTNTSSLYEVILFVNDPTSEALSYLAKCEKIAYAPYEEKSNK